MTLVKSIRCFCREIGLAICDQKNKKYTWNLGLVESVKLTDGYCWIDNNGLKPDFDDSRKNWTVGPPSTDDVSHDVYRLINKSIGWFRRSVLGVDSRLHIIKTSQCKFCQGRFNRQKKHVNLLRLMKTIIYTRRAIHGPVLVAGEENVNCFKSEGTCSEAECLTSHWRF